MSLTPGTRLGPYEVTAKIGEGGMGEVWQAHDTKLNRDVALKILPDAFADDPDRLARFTREAKLLASLDHPNIEGIYGIEESEGIKALVLEFVEGPTLADRIKQGPIPLDEALAIAKQIAEGLEAAHEQGIIHRDLKPANIKVKEDGTVKVLDFGLAKAVERGADSDRAQSDAPTDAETRMGMVMGTDAYMSPEQARGLPVGRRADVWAFGAVLYEMLTGKQAFGADRTSEVLANVLGAEPDWRALPEETASRLRQVLRACLQRDLKQRLRDIGDVLLVMEGVFETPTPRTSAANGRPHPVGWRRAMPWVLAGVVVGGLVVGLAAWSLTPQLRRLVTRFVVSPPATAPMAPSTNHRDVVISPDGRQIVYVTVGGRLHVRPVDQLESTRLGGVEGASNPFFSPDGRWVGFYSSGDGTLKKISILGGPPITLCELPSQLRGATWDRDDTIIFAIAQLGSGLFEVPAVGGEPTVLTTPNIEQAELLHLWPAFLPGGQAVLFTIVGGAGDQASAIAVLDLETGEQKGLVPGGTNARYASTGHIVYAVQGALRGVPFDLGRLEVRGDPVPVLEGVMTKGVGAANFSLSADGSLVYISGGARGETAQLLVWVNREGREEPVGARPRDYFYPRISPDGTRVALDIRDEEEDIWIWDFARETLTRLTFDPGRDQYPVWTSNGERVIFSSFREEAANLFWKAADGTGTVERLLESPNDQRAYSISPDGRRLVFEETVPETGSDLATLSLGGERASATILQTAFNETNAEISPNGRWLAYQSDASGQPEVYVRPFPDVDEGRWLVSTGGGTRPLWAPDGRELFYFNRGAMMTVSFDEDLTAPTFTARTPTILFEGQYFDEPPGRTFDIDPDGRRFLMIRAGVQTDEAASPPELIVVENWFEELKQIVPAP